MNIQEVKDCARIIQSLLSIIAIFCGGVWSYILFVRKREVSPRANISHKITYKSLTDDKSLLHLTVMISNIGDVLISLKDGVIRLHKVSPVIPELLEYIERGEVPLIGNSNEGNWPLIGQIPDLDNYRESPVNYNDRIEPGENHELYYDFIIDSNTKLIKIYSHFTNIKVQQKRHYREIGWGLSTFHDLEL